MYDNKNRHHTVISNSMAPSTDSPHASGRSEGTSTLHARSGRRTVLKAGLGLAVVATGIGSWLKLHDTFIPVHAASDNVVVQWNNAALQAIGATGTGPTIGARALAIAHTCMYDAWTCYDTTAVPTRPNGIPRHPGANQGLGNKNQAISYAAYRALVDLFPLQASAFNTLMKNLGYDPNNTSTNTNTPIGVGNVAAQAVLTYRHSDGSNQANGYADTTGYKPVNTPDQIIDANRWQPLRAANGTVQSFMTPHWGTLTPFALTSGNQFRPAGPATADQPAYKAQVDAVLQLSAGLNDTSKVIAEYWADGPHSVTPPGHWDLLSQFASAQYLSRRNKNDPNADVKLFFALSNAIFDASIAVWECKRYYDSIRPISAAHYLYTGKQITAWGGPGKGTQTFDGGLFKSYIATPPFAEYVSGHSTFSAAGATTLQKATGSDTFGDSYTAAAGSSTIEPNITPASSVTLSWSTYSTAAIEAGMSRRYGGIHFQKADEDGRTLGQQVASQAWTKAQSYINGTAQ